MKVLSFGAVLWDIIQGKEYIGGAPFNLAAHLAKCGVRVSMQTRIGQDRLGRRAQQKITELGVDDTFVQLDPVHPTGWARVELDSDGVPTFRFPDDPAYNFIETDSETLEQVRAEQFDVICFGTLEQRGEVSGRSLHHLLDSVDFRHAFYDVNIRLDFFPESVLWASLGRSTILKLNSDEVRLLCRELYQEDLAESRFVERIASDFPVEVTCVTKGPDGCTVYAGGNSWDSQAPPVEVSDTVGSGDAFSAGFLYEYCRGKSPAEAAKTANALGAFVASCSGAVPDYSDSIRAVLGWK